VSYGIRETATGVTLDLSAASREELVKDLLAGLLEAAYAHSAQAETSEGQFVPVQAVGATLEEMLKGLVKDTLDAVHEAHGTLHAPRWLAFDENRVTANLAMTEPRAAARGVQVPGLRPLLRIESPLPSFRGTLELEVPAAH
jgi:hypothetical protein